VPEDGMLEEQHWSDDIAVAAAFIEKRRW